jgi:hypothetical protein
MTEATLERLEPELGDIRVVIARRRFDELRADESAEIDRLCHNGDNPLPGLTGDSPGNASPRP